MDALLLRLERLETEVAELREQKLEVPENGLWRYYDKNGNLLSTGRFKDGLKEGEWKWFNAQGTLLKTENYVSGKKHGLQINQVPNKFAIRTEEEYNMGTKIRMDATYHSGPWKTRHIDYDSEGKSVRDIKYGQESKVVSDTEWKDGKPIYHVIQKEVLEERQVAEELRKIQAKKKLNTKVREKKPLTIEERNDMAKKTRMMRFGGPKRKK